MSKKGRAFYLHQIKERHRDIFVSLIYLFLYRISLSGGTSANNEGVP